jgi:hypothetical protein
LTVRGEHIVEPTPLTDVAAETVSRRSALKAAALGGLALTAAGAVAVAVAERADAAISLPQNQRQPVAADLPLLGFLCSIERAADAVYGAAAAVSGWADDQAAVVLEFQAHHRLHAGGYAALAGQAAPIGSNAALVKEYTAKVSAAGKPAPILKVLEALEEALVATAVKALGVLVGTDGSDRVAAVLTTDSRHAVVLGGLAGTSAGDFLPSFEGTTGAFDQTKYPVG